VITPEAAAGRVFGREAVHHMLNLVIREGTSDILYSNFKERREYITVYNNQTFMQELYDEFNW
jgi:hypothetical protein